MFAAGSRERSRATLALCHWHLRRKCLAGRVCRWFRDPGVGNCGHVDAVVDRTWALRVAGVGLRDVLDGRSAWQAQGIVRVW